MALTVAQAKFCYRAVSAYSRARGVVDNRSRLQQIATFCKYVTPGMGSPHRNGLSKSDESPPASPVSPVIAHSFVFSPEPVSSPVLEEVAPSVAIESSEPPSRQPADAKLPGHLLTDGEGTATVTEFPKDEKATALPASEPPRQTGPVEDSSQANRRSMFTSGPSVFRRQSVTGDKPYKAHRAV